MDMADLHDHEIKEVGRIWNIINQKYARRANTRANLQELAKEATGLFLDAGFVINVRWENNLVVNPTTMQPYPIELEVLGRVPGTQFKEDGFDMFDHERKRHEVLSANDRGEAFLGQKEKAN